MTPKQHKRLGNASNRVTSAWNAGVFPQAYQDGRSEFVKRFMETYNATENIEAAVLVVEVWAQTAQIVSSKLPKGKAKL